MREINHGNIIEPFGIDTLFTIIYDSLKDKMTPKDVLELIDPEEDDNKIIK